MISEYAIPLSDGLFGTLTRPDDQVQTRPAVILLNAGMIHRGGPFRLHAQLARRLAAKGHAVLRFDLPGVGDAAANGSLSQPAVVARVMDRVQRTIGAHGFIVGGLCSAADLSWRVAAADARVRGLILLDGLARRGFWFHIGQLRLLLRRPPQRWPRMLWRHFFKKHAIAESDFRDWPESGKERDEMAKLLARKLRLFALFTGGVSPYFLHERQFAATFPDAARSPLVSFDFWPEADHLFMAVADRQRLQDSIVAWCAREFPTENENTAT